MTFSDQEATASTSEAATSESIERAIERAYAEVTGAPRKIVLSARLAEDLELNSLQRYELLIALEEVWDVELVDSQDVTRARTVAELIGLIAAALSS